MTSTKTRIAACLAAAACALGAAGCGGSDNDDDGATTAAASGGRLAGTLTIAAWETGTPNDPLDVAARDFEAANPGVRVVFRKSPFAQYEQSLRMRLNAGETPDVARTVAAYGGPVTALTLASKNLLTDLSDQPWTRDLPQSVSFTTDLDGRTYAFPVETSALGALHDVDVLRRAGAEVPTTFDEVLELCRRTTGDTVAYAFGAQQGSAFPAWVGFALAASSAYADDPDWGQQRLDDEVTFADSGWEQALERYQQMDEAGCFGDDAVGTSLEVAAAALAQGRALFAIAPNSTLPLFLGVNPRARLAMAPFAGAPDPEQVRVPASPAVALVVPRKAGEPELGQAFVEFYAENRLRYNAIDNSIPSLPDADGRLRLPAYAAALAPYFDSGRTTVLADAQWPAPEVRAAYDNGLVQILLGDAAPADVLEAMDAAWTSTPR